MSEDSTHTQDLTQPMHGRMYVYGGDPEFGRRTPGTGAEEEGLQFQVSELSMGSHTGTHVDAPRHYYPDGATIDEFGVDEFRLDAVVVAVDAAADEPFAPDVDAVVPEPGSVVVFRTGWDEHWGEERYDSNPYLSAETVACCADQGWHVAVDAPSPDPARDGRSDADTDFLAHEVLLGEELLVFENLTNLDAVPDDEPFELHAYPLPIVGCDGSPVRAVGVWEE